MCHWAVRLTSLKYILKLDKNIEDFILVAGSKWRLADISGEYTFVKYFEKLKPIIEG
jgi:hypothetical protein